VVILRAHHAGLNIVFHVHDEVVIEASAEQSLKQVEDIFSTPIDWCEDLPLKGAGYTTPYYLKD
jgi:DNA polymerase